MKKLLFAILLLTTACKKDEPGLPLPQAAFESRSVVEVDEPVSFTNRSTEASRYEWDFGNGQTSTQALPATTYNTAGSYTVTLRSYNTDNRVSTTTQAIRVGKRYLKSIVIKNMSFVQPNGQPWGMGNGSLNIYMKYSARPFVPFITDSAPSVTSSLLPLTLVTTPHLNIREMRKGTTWTFALENYAYASGNTYHSPELMYSWVLPIGDPTANRDANGNGSYSLTGPTTNPNSYNVEVNYETL